MNNYHPVSIDEILEKVKKHNEELPLSQCFNPPLSMRNGDIDLKILRDFENAFDKEAFSEDESI